jgi:hypothetical protein
VPESAGSSAELTAGDVPRAARQDGKKHLPYPVALKCAPTPADPAHRRGAPAWCGAAVAVLLARCCWRGRREHKPGDGQLTRGALACSDEESSASSDSDAEEVTAGSHGEQAPRDVEVQAHEEEKKKTQEDKVMCVARAARQREIPAGGSGCVLRRFFRCAFG